MSDARDDAEALRARKEQFERYARWEAEQEATRERTLSADLAWLSEALELSRKLAPDLYTEAAAIERGQRRARWLATMIVAERPQP
ncbi:MAG: hypothetical protein U0704_06045 [Candidatus Eisenbacteria bacterium]